MRHRAALWFPVALLVAVQIMLAVRGDSPLSRGELWTADGYMRLVRVEALYETGAWYDGVVHRSNAPYGESMHWTRPLDIVLLAGAAPLASLVGFKTALYWWGALIGPVLHVLALLALMWAARPLFDRQALVYLGVLAIVQPALLWYFAAGRPDHHGLISLLFVVLLGLVLRLLAHPFAARTAAAAGAAAAVLLWVGVEGLAAAAFALAALGLDWVAAPERRAGARKGLVFSAALTVGLAAALLAERPWGDLGAVEYDRISVVHVAVFAAITAAWLAARAVERGTALCATAGGRAAVALAGAAAAGGAVWLGFPKFYGGPMVDVDPRVIALWFPNELRGLVAPGDLARTLREGLLVLGPALLAIPFLLHLLWRERGPARRAWMGVALGLAVFVPLALYQRRWATYAEFLVVLPYAALLVRTLGPLGGAGGGTAPRDTTARGVARAAARAFVVAAFATGFVILAEALPRPAPTAGANGGRCPLPAVAAYLDDWIGDGRRRRLLSFIGLGPEILYRTRHEVVATPFHRNRAGMFDADAFFGATDEGAARKIVERRGIDLVLVCHASPEAARHRAPGWDGAATLYRRLENGEPPGWLRPVDLPGDLGEAFGLYRVANPAQGRGPGRGD